MGDEQMSEKEFIAANFFTPEGEMPPKKRPRRKMPADVAALKYFARKAVDMTPIQRRAAINWLYAAYLE